jgi:hypothetical protein
MNVVEIEIYFLTSIQKLLEFYQHKTSILICHSFSAYLALLFIARERPIKKLIKQLVLFSPIGITPKT